MNYNAELWELYGDGDGGRYSFHGIYHEDDDDKDDVEHGLLVDSCRRLEQHNIMISITGATARSKTRSNT